MIFSRADNVTAWTCGHCGVTVDVPASPRRSSRALSAIKAIALVLALAGATFAACDAKAQDRGRAYPFARTITLEPAPVSAACPWTGPLFECLRGMSPEARAEIVAADRDLAIASRMRAGHNPATVAIGRQIAALAAQRRGLVLGSARTTEPAAKVDPYAADPFDGAAAPGYADLDAFAAVYDVPAQIEQLFEKIKEMVRP